MINESMFLKCEYSNGMGDTMNYGYTASKGGLLTADEVLSAMLDAMKGFGFMENSIAEAVISKAEELEYMRKKYNDK